MGFLGLLLPAVLASFFSLVPLASTFFSCDVDTSLSIVVSFVVFFAIVEKHTLGSSEEEDMAEEIDPDPEKTDQIGRIASFDNAIKCELCDMWSNSPLQFNTHKKSQKHVRKMEDLD